MDKKYGSRDDEMASKDGLHLHLKEEGFRLSKCFAKEQRKFLCEAALEVDELEKKMK